MASVSGVNSSNMNSLYGSRNVISGLASGMDTESMIMKSVSGIQAKIASLQQKQTKVSWKQVAYQDVTDKLVQFSRKYSSYSSSTNLLSSSFFNKAVNTTTNGKYADLVSATGRSNSSVSINGVSQLASSTRYQIGQGGVLNAVGTGTIIDADTSFDINGTKEASTLEGILRLNYGNSVLDLKFSQDDLKDVKDLNAFKDLVVEKLGSLGIPGKTETADKFIKVEVSGDKLSFSNSTSDGSSVYVKGMAGLLAKTLEDSDIGEAANKSLSFKDVEFNKQTPYMDLIGGKSMSFTLDGTTKKITIPTKAELDKYRADNGIDIKDSDTAFVKMLQDKLDSSFGTGKITVGDSGANTGVDADGNPTTPPNLQLKFTVAEGSSLSVTSEASETMGLKKLESTYLNTSKTLGDLLNGTTLNGMAGYTIQVKEDDRVLQKDGSYKDKQGNTIDKDGFRINKKGEKQIFYDMNINGKTIGSYTKDTALETIMLDINSNAEAGVSVSYSKITNQFVFTSKNSGAGYDITMTDTVDTSVAPEDSTKTYVTLDADGKPIPLPDPDPYPLKNSLSSAIFGKFSDANADKNKHTRGSDAEINLTVNGSNMTIKRSSNTFDVDGMSVTVNGLFNNEVKTKINADGTTSQVNGFTFADENGNVTTSLIKDPTTFTTKADADKIVGVIKDMVKDYNEMITSLREAFNTIPAQKTNGAKYEPLTDAQKEGMTESAIENYEEKAKQGLLFGDSDLSALYTKLTSALSPAGTDGSVLRSMGISTEYSKGLTTINLDETKLRDALSTNPDAVKSAFTKVKGEGSATNGLMVNMKSVLDTYASVEGSKKGVLITKAGSKYSVTNLLDNPMKKELESYDKQIETWQDKLSDKVDFYTRQYTRLEQLMAQMNSQSESIYSMMMGGQ